MGMPSDFEAAYDLIRSGRARVHVDRVFPLAEAAAAHEHLEAGEQFGKVVLGFRASRSWVPNRDELRVVRHAVGRPRRIEGQLGLGRLDSRNRPRGVENPVRDHRAGRAAHGREAVE